LSADHLEYLDDAGIAAMAKAGTVATLLPGAYYFTRETRVPPVERLRGAGVPIALATDCNPGTSPLTSLLLVMNMGATLFRLTVEECLIGVTRNAARAACTPTSARSRRGRAVILRSGMSSARRTLSITWGLIRSTRASGEVNERLYTAPRQSVTR
jgi:imidazolonepropionase